MEQRRRVLLSLGGQVELLSCPESRKWLQFTRVKVLTPAKISFRKKKSRLSYLRLQGFLKSCTNRKVNSIFSLNLSKKAGRSALIAQCSQCSPV